MDQVGHKYDPIRLSNLKRGYCDNKYLLINLLISLQNSIPYQHIVAPSPNKNKSKITIAILTI